MKLLTIIGTRPEAVKMAPVLRALASRDGIGSIVVSTGQHRDLIDDPLDFFGLSADRDLELMKAGHTPERFLQRAVAALGDVLAELGPDRVIVQGDTTSAMAGAEAAARQGIPVSHGEAGLRTWCDQPWPEEAFRTEIDRLADQLFAPTPSAAENLAREPVRGIVHVTGNSGIDALHFVLRALATDAKLRARCDAAMPVTEKPFVLATLHRRESIGAGTKQICSALAEIAQSGLADVVIPVHPNPAIERLVRPALENRPGIHLLPPQPYPAMVRLMQRADLILTDSGGIQEEAPSLGKQVLVLREVTERPEGIAAGHAQLVGTNRDAIFAAAEAALTRPPRTPLHELTCNPYGDGQAAPRIAAALLGEAYEPFGLEAEAPAPPLRLAI